VQHAGFQLLPTFSRPHFTVILPWTFLDEARQPSLIRPGTIVLAGDDDAPAVAEVVDLVPKEAGTIVHLRILPGLFDDYEALVRRVRGG
jgi:hypothetical protein